MQKMDCKKDGSGPSFFGYRSGQFQLDPQLNFKPGNTETVRRRPKEINNALKRTGAG